MSIILRAPPRPQYTGLRRTYQAMMLFVNFYCWLLVAGCFGFGECTPLSLLPDTLAMPVKVQ